MNCIFCCVFNQEKYVDMFFLLLESIFIYGDLDCDTHILIYTSTQFMNKIKQSHLFNDEKIKFEINDTYNDVGKACKARLDLFNLPSITNYNKILYLDTDILVKDVLNKVFNVCKEDILYVLEEGLLTDNDNFYGGKTLFNNEINNFKDISAFTSGILLFNNCEKIKDLFNKINEDIIERPYYFNYYDRTNCYDQPYIVYNAFKYNLYNNKILKTLVVNNDNNIHSDKVIHHFPGGPGVYQHKIDYMTIFLNSLKNQYKIFIEQISELCVLGKKYNVDKSPFFGKHTYTPEYHNLLKDKKNDINKVLEIGIGNIPLMSPLTNNNYKPGASLRMWRDYFPKANIIGCDILTDVLFNEERISTFQTDQNNEISLNKLISNIGDVDLIIDDGSHIQEHMVTSFKNLWKIIKPNGLYIIEDIHISFLNRMIQLNDELKLFDSQCIKYYKGIFESDNFVVFQKISIFDNRNEMIKYYCDKISNPKILEIGVFKGDFLEYLVKECNIGSVDCVDLFEGITCSGDADGNNVIYYDVGKSYLELSEKYKDVLNIRLHKSNSITFLQNQEDNKYDIIYIDGDHSYNGVKNDLTNAYNKIQNGGYIMGHDYEMNMKKAKNIYDFGVKKAVDEFCINYKQTIISKANDGCVSFCIHINKI
jgi:lipopolysaccharide biosynthesis glycosyltransferase